MDLRETLDSKLNGQDTLHMDAGELIRVIRESGSYQPLMSDRSFMDIGVAGRADPEEVLRIGHAYNQRHLGREPSEGEPRYDTAILDAYAPICARIGKMQRGEVTRVGQNGSSYIVAAVPQGPRLSIVFID